MSACVHRYFSLGKVVEVTIDSPEHVAYRQYKQQQETLQPLFEAVDTRDPVTLRSLLESGLNPNQAHNQSARLLRPTQSDSSDSFGNPILVWFIVTPLMLAAKKGYAECVLILLEFGANPNFINEDDKSAIDSAREQFQTYVKTNDGGQTLSRRVFNDYNDTLAYLQIASSYYACMGFAGGRAPAELMADLTASR